MRYVGIDVHQRMSAICILDENGKKEKALTVRGNWSKLFKAVEAEREAGPVAVCYEASNGYGFLYDHFSRMAERVVVAHPGQLRLIFRSKRKNDRVDAEKLAKLLFLDEVPPVYVPRVDVRAWRRLITFRHKCIAERTRVKNRLRGLLRRNGIEIPEWIKLLWTRKGLAWLAGLEWPEEGLALERDILVEELHSCGERVGRIERHLNATAKSHPGVQILMTIPGVGPRTAEAMVAWIDNVNRFARIKQIGSYFGLVPSQDSSAGFNRLGHITRQGPGVVRMLLTEAAWQAIRRAPPVQAFYQRVQRGDPNRRKIAIVATAHHLARVMAAMLRSGEPWRKAAA